jgi:scavenger receptor class B, member 1
MDIYLFNWTNPGDVKNVSSKPKFTQLGPYRFREHLDKLNIRFHDSNTTVSYRKISKYFFDPEGSNGSLTDLCTTVNMIAIGTGVRVKNDGWFSQKTTSMALSSYGQKLSVTKTVSELLFEGYKDSLLDMATLFDSDPIFDRVGFLYKKNNTDVLSGTYEVLTGVDDIYKLGSIKNYNNLSEFPFYEGECKKLKGSAGEFFSPEPSLSQPIWLFTPDMCRSIPYDYEKDIRLHGVKGHRFAAGDRALDNGTLYNETKCFASEEFLASGVMNISICNKNQPMFMSFPHFYGADESYVNSIDGLQPDINKHQAYITLEPVSNHIKICQNKSLMVFMILDDRNYPRSDCPIPNKCAAPTVRRLHFALSRRAKAIHAHFLGRTKICHGRREGWSD